MQLHMRQALFVVELRWVEPPEAAGALGRRCAAFFAQNVDGTYLSPADAAAGRCSPDGTWTADLEQVVAAEIADSTGAPGRSDGVHLAVAFDGTDVLGMAIVAHDVGDPMAVIDDLLLARETRGAGIGSRFVRWIEAELAAVGVSEVHLETSQRNPRARSLFEGLGFEPVAVHFARRIAPANRD